MKISTLIALASITLGTANALQLPHIAQETPAPEPRLMKRMRDVIINKEYAKQQELKKAKELGLTSSNNIPPKWVRTVGDIVEIVQPTVIEGVTFSAKPPATTNGLEPWVTLKDDGSPKTIKPQVKNGITKNAWPTYGTWYQTATTKVWTKEELRAHNMADDEVFEEVIYVEEGDLHDHNLSPLIRCVPDRYKKKGIGRDLTTEPFCTPKDNAQWRKDKTYFITWYSRYFGDGVKNVRFHLSHIKESARYKGLKKREDEVEGDELVEEAVVKRDDDKEVSLDKRSAVLQQGGKISEYSFYSSDWTSNEQGFFPIFIDKSWFGKEYVRKVLLSIQPDDISDEDFDHYKDSIVVEISQGSKVSKGHLEDLKKLEEKYANRHLGESIEVEEGIDYEKYILMMTMPTCVILAAFGMYIFVTINKVDLSGLKKRKFARERTTHRRIPFKRKNDNPYSPLPQYNSELNTLKHD
ncbi:uncharacterized protein J8A68_000939 [[Candida] subhashii]|uniref:Uncharacterized protein n=1 Tax=[Candida] subhashii TaxID=561895 RepID=A0A8J5UT32_9ASCO|nr:uncharacterized protein J8A68_000939 [[Candida] subhashii]KAG7665537.1 hypothetical protein J8A68_000939 [[Candida] subhashii]